MGKRHPLIFISNDDGYQASGIRQLIEILRPLGRIVVMAPDAARSGYSMAMTSDRPIQYKLVQKEEGLEVYSCTGTPVDCAKLAFQTLFQEDRPDLVVSGINHGDNAAVNVHYSGTMGVVIEGCLKNIPSIGFSSCDYDKNANFLSFSSVIYSLSAKALLKGFPEGVCLNVNFPKGEEYKGVRICCQDKGDWHEEWEKCTRKDGSAYYFLSGYYESKEPDNQHTDRWALTHGYVSVTPTLVDLTAYQFMDSLQTWIKE